MAGSLHEILSTKVTTRVVSRVAATTSNLLAFFGFGPTAARSRPDAVTTETRNSRRVGTRQHGYDIFNDARTVGQGRAPGTPAGTVTRQKVGRVDVTIPRMAEKLPLQAEELHNLRRIGQTPDAQDVIGEDFVRRQQRFMGQRAANFRLALTSGMMRGKLYAHQSGDEIYYDHTSASALFTIDWQIPSGNINQLNMLAGGNIIDVSWANTSADIPLHLTKIDEALQELVGVRLDLIMCRGRMWQNVINNLKVQAQGGTSNTPFDIYERRVGVGSNGLPLTLKMGRLRCAEFVEWVISDEGVQMGLQASPTYTPFVGVNDIWFGPNPNSDLFEMIEGTEPISEGYGKPIVARAGLHAWTKFTDDPAGYHLFANDNALPCNYVPAASGYATPVF